MESKCLKCNDYSGEELFCIECEDEGYHICRDCEKVLQRSVYVYDIGEVVCKECATEKYFDFDEEQYEEAD